MSSGWDFAAARAARYLSVINLDVGRLLRLSRFPRTEPYWGKRKAYRFDDPAQLYGASYAAQELKVAFAETVLHQKGDFIGGQWVIAEANILERHIVRYTRPAKPALMLADLSGVTLKALGLNNDLCSSDDYTDSMAVSSALHAQLPDLDGIMYVSRQMNTGLAVALFERSKVELQRTVTRLVDHPDYDQLLNAFNVEILPSGRAP